MTPPATSNHGAARWADATAALLIAVGTALYLSLLPRNLGIGDESYFLYEAKRIRDGEVMYRDVFQFVTPLASYVMAGLFWLFGTTVGTARVCMSVVHALTGAALYASSRQLGVRRELALLVPLAYLAVCQSAWPYASWHWFSTFFTVLVLLALLARPADPSFRWSLILGLINGALICTQQQKGTVLAVGTGAILLTDFLIDRRYTDRQSARDLVCHLAFFATGVAAIVLPVMLAFIVLAGWRPLYDALVLFPLENYRTTFRCSWGAIFSGTFGSTYPVLLKYSPLALLLPLVRAATALARRRDRLLAKRLAALIILSASSVGSIWYFPDIIHIAFIAGLFWIAASEGLEWLLRVLDRPELTRPMGAFAALLVGGTFVGHLMDNSYALAKLFPVPHETAFGRVDFAFAWEADFFDATHRLLNQEPSRDLFCYAEMSAPYLILGAVNPTPYQYLLAGVSPDRQIRETLEILEARRVQYIIGWAFASMPPADPIGQFIRQHYERVAIAEIVGARAAYVLYRRKTAGTAPS